MMAILLREGFSVDKSAGKDNTFAISVDKKNFSASVDLLRLYGFPKEEFTGIGSVFKKSGLVSSPTEERIRFMYALSQEIEETLSNIDGVVRARVHVVLPENNPYADKLLPSSASIFIKYRDLADLEGYIPQIKSLVVNSIEGLSYDNVSLATFPVNEPQFVVTPPVNVSKKESKTKKERSVGEILLFVVLVGGIGFVVYTVIRKRRQMRLSKENL